MPLDAPISYARPDWADRLRAGRSLLPDLPMDAARADRASAIFDRLRVPDSDGQPAMGDVAGPWFRAILRMSFGAEDPDTGMPLVNEVFLLVPKKNAKTTYAAAMGLTALLMSDTPNQQMMILGPTQTIADRCMAQMVGMIKADPLLRKVFHVQEHLKRITRVKTGTTLSVKTFDMNVVTGEIPTLTIVDELHLLGTNRHGGRVVKQITGGTVTNPRALVVYITTQSDAPPQGVFKEKLDYARKVRDGAIADRVRMLAVLYEFPPELQADPAQPWRDPENWAMVLPNLGRSVLMDRLLDLFAQAVEEGPESVKVWASQHLNIEIGVGILYDNWAGAAVWDKQAVQGQDLDAILALADVAVVGIDGGGLDDLLGLCVLGRHATSRRWMAWCQAWAQPVVLERRKDIAEHLRGLERAGDLTICRTPTEDIEAVAAICARLNAAGLLPKAAAVGLDPVGVVAIVDALQDHGLADDQLAAVSQGWKLTGAIKGTERKLFDGSLTHAGQPMMAWCVGNAKCEPRGNAVVVTKAVSGSGKIDPLMALFNAVHLMSQNPVAAKAAAFEYTGM